MKFHPIVEMTNEIITELEMFKHFVRELPDKADAHLIIAWRKIEQLQRESALLTRKSGEVRK